MACIDDSDGPDFDDCVDAELSAGPDLYEDNRPPDDLYDEDVAADHLPPVDIAASPRLQDTEVAALQEPSENTGESPDPLPELTAGEAPSQVLLPQVDTTPARRVRLVKKSSPGDFAEVETTVSSQLPSPAPRHAGVQYTLSSIPNLV